MYGGSLGSGAGVLALVLGVVASTPALAQDGRRVGSFHFIEEADPFGEAHTVFMFSVPEPGSHRDVSLAWGCTGPVLNVVLATGYMAGDSRGRVSVRYRFDEETPAEPALWPQTPGNAGALIPLARLNAFTESARRSRSVVVRVVDPLDGETKTATFPLVRFNDALRNLPCAEAYLAAGGDR